MGLFGGSKSETEQTDRRIGVTDRGLVATEGARITHITESVDPEVAGEALAEAFDFGDAALRTVDRVTGKAVRTVDRVTGKALRTVDRATDRALDFGGDALDLIADTVRRLDETGERTAGLAERAVTAATAGSEQLQGLQSLLRTLAILGAAAAAVAVLRR